MKKLTAILLLLIIQTFNVLMLTSCFDGGYGKPDAENGWSGEDSPNDKIRVPVYKDYERGTVDFEDIIYERPDVAAAVSAFENVTAIIKENTLEFEKQIEAITGLEPILSNVDTMTSYANLRSSIDTESIYWNDEYEYLSSRYPSLSQAIENMFVAAATSPNAERFEEEYFGKGLIEEYADGGNYTDALVALMKSEADLISRYTALSHSTVTITYEGITATYDAMLDILAQKYDMSTSSYKNAERKCELLYEAALEAESAEILIELFKVRSKIGGELSSKSYTEYAYESIYHDYSAEEYVSFAEDIKKYVIPVYASLSKEVFSKADLSDISGLGRVKLLNSAAEMIENTDEDLYSIYSYMLQHSLYDVKLASFSRFDGAFTTYLENYSAPFLFFSTEGKVSDYSTLFHEFGHFADAFVNFNSTTSLDLSEVSSGALELMMLTRLEGKIESSDLERMRIYLMESALTTLIFQGFYSMFEHIAYKIPTEDISRETLGAAVSEAAEAIGLRSDVLKDIRSVMIPHIFRYPFYVQSYCTSVTAALEIYFIELDSEGEGFAVYKDLLVREEDMTFTEHLKDAGLTSPFEKQRLRSVANRIHRELLGFDYFKSADSGVNGKILPLLTETEPVLLPSHTGYDAEKLRAA